MVVNCAGATIWITPPQLHINFESFCSAGMLPTSTVGDPGAHGAAVTGTQGIGVSTPIAAAVAAATCGLAGQLHMPNGMTLTIGALSMIVAAGAPDMTHAVGSTFKEEGATPKLHCNMVPVVTRMPIDQPFTHFSKLATTFGKPPAAPATGASTPRHASCGLPFA